MPELTRLKPEPTPAIHPLAEYLAEGRRKEWYEDMKRVFQVPWMGVVTMAFSHYPTFFAELWRGARALCASQAYVDACRANRAFAEAEAAKLGPPPIRRRLEELGYAPREIEQIREIVDVFGHGNQPYVILAAIARHLLEIGEMAGAGPAPECAERHGPAYGGDLTLMEAHHADAETRAVYDDVKRTLGLPFVNTDYRAFARWPSYWAAAWTDLRGAVVAREYEALCLAFHERCAALAARELPNPGGLSAEALRQAAAQDAPFEEVRDVCRLFQWLLPGLVINVAYLRRQLEAA